MGVREGNFVAIVFPTCIEHFVATAAIHKLGAYPMPVMDDDFCSVGELAYVDEEGYLYLSDRRVGMIISGGATSTRPKSRL